jgi:hypothetical protein
MATPNLTPGRVAADGQTFTTNPSLAWWQGACWALDACLDSMTKLEKMKGFKSQRNWRVTRKLRELIATNLLSQLTHAASLFLVNPPEELNHGIITTSYNLVIGRIIREHPDLASRSWFLEILRQRLTIPGWKICANPTCAKLFESTVDGEDLCSARCRKSASNREQWKRRKETPCGAI